MTSSRPNLTYALRLACYALRVRPEHLDVTRREHVVKRAALWWLLRTTTDASLPEIARTTGAANHTSVFAGIRRHEAHMLADPVEAQRSEVTAEWIGIAWATRQARRNERRPLLAAGGDGR